MKNFKTDNTSGTNHEGVNSNMPLRYLTATSIIDDKVMNPANDHMGNIKDIMIDLYNGKIEYFIIELGGFLGIGEKYFAFPYSVLIVDPIAQTFILDQDLETLKKAPGFDKDHWPGTNSHQFEHAKTYWGDFMGPSTGGVPYSY
ncbi:MAG: sporulation protein YlmC with PRC-barrel domain [Cyclobacteriaceae bacterium]|jgi:sporulation protein YlmC with PRC-barrel domain